MEVVAMLFLIVLAVILTAVAVVFLLPDLDPDPDAGAPRTDADGELSGSTGASPPTTLEGALVAELLSAEISASQYRHAVARLAARDDERNPVSVPDAGGPDACV
jgi:hypothetical protein